MLLKNDDTGHTMGFDGPVPVIVIIVLLFLE